MIDHTSLVSPAKKPQEEMCVAMAVKVDEKIFYMLARVRNGQWISHDPEYKLPPNLLGWTGIDSSWGHRNE